MFNDVHVRRAQRPGENSDVVVVQPLLCTMCGVLVIIVMLEDDGISGEGVVMQCP